MDVETFFIPYCDPIPEEEAWIIYTAKKLSLSHEKSTWEIPHLVRAGWGQKKWDLYFQVKWLGRLRCKWWLIARCSMNE